MPVDDHEVLSSDPDEAIIRLVAEVHGAIADWVEGDERVTWEWVANLVRGPGRLDEALFYVQSRLKACGTSNPALAGKLCALEGALEEVRKAQRLRAIQQLVDEFPTPAPDYDTIDRRYEWATNLPPQHRAEGIARVTAERVDAIEARLANRTLADADAVAAQLEEWGPSTASFATAAKIREHVKAQRMELASAASPPEGSSSASDSDENGPELTAEEKAIVVLRRHPGWNMRQIANEAGISYSALRNPKKYPDFHTARRLLAAGRNRRSAGTKYDGRLEAESG